MLSYSLIPKASLRQQILPFLELGVAERLVLSVELTTFECRGTEGRKILFQSSLD